MLGDKENLRMLMDLKGVLEKVLREDLSEGAMKVWDLTGIAARLSDVVESQVEQVIEVVESQIKIERLMPKRVNSDLLGECARLSLCPSIKIKNYRFRNEIKSSFEDRGFKVALSKDTNDTIKVIDEVTRPAFNRETIVALLRDFFEGLGARRTGYSQDDFVTKVWELDEEGAIREGSEFSLDGPLEGAIG